VLPKLDYCLQANRTAREGSSQADRDVQIRYINDHMKGVLASGEPAISLSRYLGISINKPG